MLTLFLRDLAWSTIWHVSTHKPTVGTVLHKQDPSSSKKRCKKRGNSLLRPKTPYLVRQQEECRPSSKRIAKKKWNISQRQKQKRGNICDDANEEEEEEEPRRRRRKQVIMDAQKWMMIHAHNDSNHEFGTIFRQKRWWWRKHEENRIYSAGYSFGLALPTTTTTTTAWTGCLVAIPNDNATAWRRRTVVTAKDGMSAFWYSELMPLPWFVLTLSFARTTWSTLALFYRFSRILGEILCSRPSLGGAERTTATAVQQLTVRRPTAMLGNVGQVASESSLVVCKEPSSGPRWSNEKTFWTGEKKGKHCFENCALE